MWIPSGPYISVPRVRQQSVYRPPRWCIIIVVVALEMLLLVYRKKWFLSGEMLIYFYFYFKWRESTAESACIAAWVGAIWRKSTRETNPEVFSRQQKKQGTNLVIVLAKGLCSRLTSEWAASLSQNRRLVVSAVPRTGLARTQISAFCVSSFAREKVPRGGGGLEHAKSILL